MFAFSAISKGIKRYIWQTLTIAILVLVPMTTFVQGMIISFLVLRTCLDLWSYFNFKPYSLINKNKQPGDWKNILQEFSKKNERIAFFGFTRENISEEIEQTIMYGKIKPTPVNLCGPIAFLNFLIVHDPALFVKTLCEYAENGCTQAPFYLQSSFWDRYFPPIKWKNRTFRNYYTEVNIVNCEIKMNNSFCLGLAGAFLNTHNLLGYNSTCLFEQFKGYTNPNKITGWLTQAGFQSSSNVVIHNYRNNAEMPMLSRFILGGLYDKDNRKKQYNALPTIGQINLSQKVGDTPVHYLFDVAKGHWTFSGDQESETDNCIQVSTSNRSNIM
ncbi:MAG: hypothetical protein JSS07_05835 [Proteobacteria bacterium]|nr:hypothetical protein [Pseudomonadota bacterium]